MDRIASTLARLPALPDLIALQEVETRSWRGGLDAAHQVERFSQAFGRELEQAGRDTRYSTLYFPAHQYAGPIAPIYTTGLAILVASPLVIEDHNADSPWDITHRRFRWTASWKQTRICGHVGVRTPTGERFDLFNTHLSLPAFIDRRGPWYPARMGHGKNQLREADSVIECMAERARGSRILVGDFNSMPDSPVHRKLVEEGGLTDVFRHTHGDTHWPTNGTWNLRLHLDHVFACNGLDWLDFEGSQPFGVPSPFHGLSDHVPKVGRFRRVLSSANAESPEAALNRRAAS